MKHNAFRWIPAVLLAALLCAAAVALALLPAQVWAQSWENGFLTVSETQDNPLYPAQVTADDSNGTSLLAAGGMSSFDTAAQAADYITRQFKARENMAFFYTGYPADGPFSAEVRLSTISSLTS